MRLLLQDVGGILDLAASGAGQIAAEQRLQHQDQRILLSAGKLLPEHVARTVHICETGTGMYEEPLVLIFYQASRAQVRSPRTPRKGTVSCIGTTWQLLADCYNPYPRASASNRSYPSALVP